MEIPGRKYGILKRGDSREIDIKMFCFTKLLTELRKTSKG